MIQPTKTMIVRVKQVYGNDLIYPVCELAAQYIKLQGRKTFTDTDIKTLKLLGIAIKHEEIRIKF